MPIGNPVTLTSNVASKTISVTATASQTLFNVTGGYRINELGVFKNGLRLQDGVDYTARDGLTVTLLSAASGGDKLQFVVFDTFRVAEAIRPAVDEQTIRGNLNVVGILSCTDLEGPVSLNITSGIQTFHDVRVGGALTVAGTLTYEDTTNSNVTGLATFSGGMNIAAIGATATTLNVTGVATVGNNISIGDSIFHTGDGGGTAFGFPAADTFTVYTNDSERLRVDSAGLVKVGGNETVSAATGIQIENAGAALLTLLRNDLTITNGNTLGGIDFYGNDGGSVQQVAKISAIADGTHGDNDKPTALVFHTTNDNEGSATERLRITSAGLVGIGTNNPTAKLQVENDAADATIARFESNMGTNNSRGISIKSPTIDSASEPFIFDTGNAYEFQCDSVVALQIKFNRNIGIGTDDPAMNVHIESGTPYIRTKNTAAPSDEKTWDFNAGTDGILRFRNTNDAANSSNNWLEVERDGVDTDSIRLLTGTGSERLRITSAGQVGINSTNPGNKLSVDGDIGIYGSGTNHRNLYIYKNNVATAWFKYRGDNNVVVIGNNAGDKLTINPSGDLNVAGITTATQLFEGTTRVASTGKAIAMAMLFG